MKMKHFILSLAVCLLFFPTLVAQNTVVTDDAGYSGTSSAILDVKSDSKGFLIPRVDSTQMYNIAGPVAGLLVYNTTFNSFCYYEGAQWLILGNQRIATTAGADDPLFKVVNAQGDTVFAVYPEGVRINVGDGYTKGTGNKGGFAVGGFTTGKSAGKEFLRVTADSVRVYIDTISGKGTGNKGGFAVGGYTTGKGVMQDILRVSQDSVRIYIDTDGLKGTGNKGGFAVGGYTTGKLTPKQYLRVTTDSTRIYVSDTVAGFAIGSNKNEQAENFLDFTRQNYSIGHRSGDSITFGRFNTFYGFEAGFRNKIGNGNAFIGYLAGHENISGNKNIFLGWASGFKNTNGNENIFIGYNSGYENINGL